MDEMDWALLGALGDGLGLGAAARRIGVPKQTLSRRLQALEDDVGVPLVARGGRLRLTEAGETLAARARDLARRAHEAREEARRGHGTPVGTLRVVADPHFAQHFLGTLLSGYLRAHPAVSVEAILHPRNIDLADTAADVAFRIGPRPGQNALDLGPAAIAYCAAPSYLERRGTPASPDELADHDGLVLDRDAGGAWPFRDGEGIRLVSPPARLRSDAFPLLADACLAGLGITAWPRFEARRHLEAGRLREVLADHVPDVGRVWIVLPGGPRPPAKVTALRDLALRRFQAVPWA